MTESTEIHDRVTDLEHDVVKARYLASKADKEASRNTATLRGQVGLLNALRETQVEHGETLAKHTKMLADHGKRLNLLEHKVDQIDHKVDAGFAQADENFAKVGKQLGLLHTGQERITELLTEHLDRPRET